MLYVLAFWMLGGLIGYAIANRRGFSTVAGFLGGVLLGPIFSPLMFLVTPDKKRCPKCMEWIHKDAQTCPHCQATV